MDGWVGINNCLVACGDIALLRMDPAHCEEVGRGDPFRALETDRFLHRVPGGNAASRLLWVSNCPPHPSLPYSAGQVVELVELFQILVCDAL